MRLIDADETIEAIEVYAHELACIFGNPEEANRALAVKNIIDDQPEVAAALEWISVKEKLPKDDGYNGTVLATDGSIVIAAPSSSVTINGVIIHWMPLPDLPKMDGGEGE